MKHILTWVVAASLGMPVYAQPSAEEPPQEVPGTTFFRECLSRGDDTHSQGQRYRAGCLELVDYFTGENESLPTGLFPGQDTPPATLNVRAWKGGKYATVTLESVTSAEGQPRYFIPRVRPIDNRNPCLGEGKDGYALAVPGYWDKGTWRDTKPGGDSAFTLSCVTGAVAKCALWGYEPWERLGSYHQACVQVVRARYNFKNDDSFTCDGTPISISDRIGLVKNSPPASWTLESLWSKTGIICLNHGRRAGCEAEIAAAGVKPCPAISIDAPSGWPDDVLIAVSSEGKPTPSGKCPMKPGACTPRR